MKKFYFKKITRARCSLPRCFGRSDPWSRPVAFVRPLPSQDRRLSQGKSPDHDNVVVVRLFPQMFTSISLQIPSTGAVL